MLLFLYGTLKHGGANHRHMDGQKFVAHAATAPRYRLYDLGGYPGMVSVKPMDTGLSIQGEIWDVDEAALARLDELEDIEGGEYAREVIPMLAPHDQLPVEGYRYLRPIIGRRNLGSFW